MKAHEIPVGDYFCGLVGRAEWNAEAGTPQKRAHFPGELVSVSGHGPYGSYMETLMNAMAEEASPETAEILWVYGQREKRSKFVKLVGWRIPFAGGARLSHLLDLYKVLSKMTSAQPSQHREYREAEHYLKEKWPDEFAKFEELWLPERRRA